MKISVSAVQVTSIIQSQGSRFSRSTGYHVVFMEIFDCPAVGNEISLEAPVAAKYFLKGRTSAAGLSVSAVVSTHEAFHVSLLCQGLKCWQIGFLHIFLGNNCVKFMTDGFRTGVDCEMLGTGSGFHNITVSLDAFYKSNAQFFGEVRVFAVGFMSASPSGITENIDVW